MRRDPYRQRGSGRAAASRAARVLGMAFDIGTTTVVGYLIDLASGRELAVASALNPQVRHGFDVISRIVYGIENPDGVEVAKPAHKGPDGPTYG